LVIENFEIAANLIKAIRLNANFPVSRGGRYGQRRSGFALVVSRKDA
jgi:hypothetical protein